MSHDYSFPVDDPLVDLGPTAKRILEAAKQITLERGFGELTFAAIAEASGANRASIPYHFGNKAGLVAAMVNSFIHAEYNGLREETSRTEDPERLHRYILAKQRMSEDNASFISFFEVFAYILRDDVRRARLSEVYDWYRKMNRERLAYGVDARHDADLDGLASLMVAVTDGLGLQSCLAPTRFPARRAYAVLEEMLRLWLEAHRLPGSESASPATS